MATEECDKDLAAETLTGDATPEEAAVTGTEAARGTDHQTVVQAYSRGWGVCGRIATLLAAEDEVTRVGTETEIETGTEIGTETAIVTVVARGARTMTTTTIAALSDRMTCCGGEQGSTEESSSST